MRVLLLFRGSAGCGKSTFIKQHGLEPYALSADKIRLMCSSPELQVDGTVSVSQKNDKDVWNMLFRMLEIRMSHGEFTVIDATNSKTSEINRYKELAQNYRYRIYCIDMTDIPIEETKRRNRMREELKQVPDEVIDKFYSRFQNQKIPSGVKVLKPEELYTIWYKPMDLSKYKKVHVIGDIHGCFTALIKYFFNDDGIKSDEAYIFCGDYIDRGIENAEVMKWIIKHYQDDNMFFVEGNHERWLWLWANDAKSKSKEFIMHTEPQLIAGNISKKDVRQFYRRLAQCCYFTYHGSTFLVTHAGISNIPENLLFVATEQMIKGVGGYNNANEVDEAFTKNVSPDVFQIHGHRNIADVPIAATSRTFNLEGKVEFGGHLRAIQITTDGGNITKNIRFCAVQVENLVFRLPVKSVDDTSVGVVNEDNVDLDVHDLVTTMRNSKLIQEKNFGRVSSFNFTKQAFNRDKWNTLTTKARGLYIDTAEYNVVARAYDKFFNINERRETELGNLHFRLHFPVTAYVKENGFLGIVGRDPVNNDLLFTTKSSITGDFTEYFKALMYSIYGEDNINKMKEYVLSNNVSFVFECCDMVHDPHIIEYPESKVVLLDVINNSLCCHKVAYDELVEIANKCNFIVKEKAITLNSWQDFFAWYMEVISEDYKYNGKDIEGFVIEDKDGYMVKLKLHYYKLWKKLRGVAQSVARSGNYKWTGSLTTPLENDFFGWCKQYFNEPSNKDKDNNICTLRKLFFDSEVRNYE